MICSLLIIYRLTTARGTEHDAIYIQDAFQKGMRFAAPMGSSPSRSVGTGTTSSTESGLGQSYKLNLTNSNTAPVDLEKGPLMDIVRSKLTE